MKGTGWGRKKKKKRKLEKGPFRKTIGRLQRGVARQKKRVTITYLQVGGGGEFFEGKGNSNGLEISPRDAETNHE